MRHRAFAQQRGCTSGTKFRVPHAQSGASTNATHSSLALRDDGAQAPSCPEGAVPLCCDRWLIFNRRAEAKKCMRLYNNLHK